MTTSDGSKAPKTKTKKAWLLASALVLMLGGYGVYTWMAAPSEGEAALAAVINRVEKNFTTIQHMPADTLQSRLGQGPESDTVVFDVREPDEFKVSHISGSQQVDPGMPAAEFMRRFGNQISGKKVVFYCSVGVRSSRLAKALQATLAKQNVREVYNLKGGIFAWHNKNMSVVNKSGKTDLVHPFNERWGRLVVREDKRSYSPKPAAL